MPDIFALVNIIRKDVIRMTKTNTKVKSSGIICKGNVKGSFDMIPTTLYNYLELGLITGNELAVYIRLYQYYNVELGYAFPTISQLMVLTGIGGKSTMDKALNNLIDVGLIRKEKSDHFVNKSVYIVFQPLEKEELYSIAVDNVEKLEKKKKRLSLRSIEDKARLCAYHQQITQGV
jgi:hypothetical protein